MGISILATLLWSDQEISYNSTSTEKMKCPNCGKEVYHAECVRSLNKDWHRACLKCEHCGKTQSAGGHAEHEGKPYCHTPCYAKLFGPGGFGRGGCESFVYEEK